jgi:hypothetical protein
LLCPIRKEANKTSMEHLGVKQLLNYACLYCCSEAKII